MKMQICAIKDRATNAFMQPFFVQAVGQAIREFGNLVNDPKHPVGQHPDDYDLWHLGEWNDQDGRFNADQPAAWDIEQIAIGKNMKRAHGPLGESY